MPTTRGRCAHWFCDDRAWESSDFCILHLALPEEDDPELETQLKLEKIVEEKKTRTQEKIDAGDFNFREAKLVDFSAEGKELKAADFNFCGATFDGASFKGATFRGIDEPCRSEVPPPSR